MNLRKEEKMYYRAGNFKPRIDGDIDHRDVEFSDIKDIMKCRLDDDKGISVNTNLQELVDAGFSNPFYEFAGYDERVLDLKSAPTPQQPNHCLITPRGKGNVKLEDYEQALESMPKTKVGKSSIPKKSPSI